MLAVENRNNKDERTMGELFFLIHDELQDVNFSEVLRVILDILKEVLQDLLFLTDEQIDRFIDNFILKLPKHFAEKFSVKKVA